MTLNQLKYAIIVAESESFNEAAKKLFISQPSLSTSIHSLEEEIGVQIFRRSQNGIAVTPEGKEFIGYARQVIEQYELLDARYITKSEVKKRFSVSMQHYSFAVKAFVDMAKGHAFMNGRDYVLPEDVKKVAKCVLAHRLLLNGKARMSHVTAQDIVEEIVGKTATPKL